ncbi:EF-hand domain-containing protein [Phenylobacterium sp.]|uniref:EF-hand domain-containing protein n=1 Tax=Phenylobacterium sp. TaxID=1871053 RepID=UPI0025CCD5DC|nr:EF-hand domain-containing protein [Phenylobacterium sp.]
MAAAVGLAGGLAGLSAQHSAAQPPAPVRPGPEAFGFTQLFISPCGEPYRGKRGDPYPSALWFKQADLNHDGVVDKTEFMADHAGFFDALDSDGDGILDGPEIAFYENQVVPDVLGPGHVSLLVPPRGDAGAPALADAVLRGGEGRLILAQFGQGTSPVEGTHPNENYMPGDLARGPGQDLGARRPPPKEYVGTAKYNFFGETEPVRAADTNLNGRVTKAEFMAAAERRFKLLDKRHDGKLTMDELPLTVAQIELARQEHRKP